MAETTKNKRPLSKTFGKAAWKGLGLLSGIFIGAVLGDFILGSTLIDISHATTDPHLVAWNSLTHDTFSFLIDGAKSILQAPFLSDGVLQPYLERGETLASIDTNEMSLDQLMSLNT